ncbi:hypothetical protein [Chitinophaga vietnamensis]|uniref:hypothetical protein n=1 Tax=Chitinophaga vietnamensis TaxID=2593957 RepID=UPI00137617CC|nr:hypothetical protein [Chitinophaga vietnamensis]
MARPGYFPDPELSKLYIHTSDPVILDIRRERRMEDGDGKLDVAVADPTKYH